MLTPRFKLSQDDKHVYMTIHAPYTNVGDTEIDIDGENFLFVSSPYFLRLRLPGRIVDGDQSKCSYICDSGDFNLICDKETPGEHFENLDMITSLLAPRDIPDINPTLVEMLEESGISVVEEEPANDGKKYSYGFAHKITDEFHYIGQEFPQIFELKFPESVAIQSRNAFREKHENERFSSDHYLADFFDEELLEPCLKSTLYWNAPDFNKEIEFTDEEVAVLKEMPNKHYLLSKRAHKQVLLGLVDILYAFCYEKRTTFNEGNIESGWTINKLSATLSWFCTFDDITEVLVACYRRALVHPIFRHFELCKNVQNDVISVLKMGKKFVVKCLVEIYRIFNTNHDARYILNHLYMRDYLIFVQKCKTEVLDKLCNKIANVEIEKDDLGLDLEQLEAAAAMEEHEEGETLQNEMALQMASMSLIPGIKKPAPYVEDSDDSETSDSSSDSSDSSDDLDSDDDPS